ncbi:MAG: glycoside hydrolase TIM-barrel-like domain-containing protein [Paracoccaceae bacterium]
MATILLSAAGAALGAGFGGTVLGLSGAVIGRAVGATLGRVIDQKIMGLGSDAVEVGRIDRFRVMGASEGSAIPRVWGRQRVSGQVIWATRFLEHKNRQSSGGKGGARQTTTTYSYTISLAVALCEGEIQRIGRIWADGAEIDPASLNLRLYRGTGDQLPDPRIEAVEGAGMAPAYRGIAYVVIEDMDVGPYGNRVPQLSFEVVRRAVEADDLAENVSGVCLIPGSGEYALATTPVHFSTGVGENVSANVHTVSGKTDFAVSLDQLREELPGCGAVSLVVSWFGSDLRCGDCDVRPKVERHDREGKPMVWRAGGVGRAQALAVPQLDGAPVYGGTPADASVMEAIRAIRAGGQEVTFYPFILMDQMGGNGLADPWSDAADQPVLPWRGRISLSVAPGRQGSPDRTTLAADEVAAFFGTASVTDFTVTAAGVGYDGADEWGYRRFVLHYAALCAAAGGVDSFCIGSEMRGLTQIRGAGDSFPAVDALRQLAADVRTILGPDVKIGYAADWSEYFGYHTGGDVYFHLDPLWTDANIDFIGIDNYMPLSDWREGEAHADAHWRSIYDLDYLTANIAGGEGFDWYYDGEEGAAAQHRLAIEDGSHGEPWIFRPKDILGWWSNQHHERIGGVRAPAPTGWVPGSKPVRFVEYGCAAIDKGTNQPNRFLDPKSSESALPRGSGGRRDDLIQMQYLRAMSGFWRGEANNPVSAIYGEPMVDFGRSHAWAWDARPFPAFPGRDDIWGDTGNYAKGHWLNGRASNQLLSAVVGELAADVPDVDAAGLYALVRGYVVSETATGRAALQPLMQAYSADVVEREGVLKFRLRDGRTDAVIEAGRLAVSDDVSGQVEITRAAEGETPSRLRIGYVEAEGDFEARVAEAAFPGEAAATSSQSDLAVAMTSGEARGVAEGWLAQARIGRDSARFALPPSAGAIGAGDVVELEGARWRIDRLERTDMQLAEAVRVEAGAYRPVAEEAQRTLRQPVIAPVPVAPIYLDLPLLKGDETPHAPHVAVAASPWPGTVAIWHSDQDEGYALNRLVDAGATVGVTENPLVATRTGRWDHGAALRVRVSGGGLSSSSVASVLNGANAAAIGDGANWEVFQFSEAELVAANTYELRRRLRGQAGTDGIMPAVWPVGSTVVFLSDAVPQLDMSSSNRGLARYYRAGVATRGYDDAQVVTSVQAFEGVGLRPYRVAHLRARGQGADLAFFWVRRTRIDGDSWLSAEVPLGEEREAYSVRVRRAGSVVRSVECSAPQWTYTAAMQAADGAAGTITVEVAQLSDRFGAGPFEMLEVTIPS